MKKMFAVAALFACAASSAQPFPPIGSDGETHFHFRTVNGGCMPSSLARELSEAGATVYQDKRDGKLCCPAAARHVSPKTVDASLWRKIQPFTAARSSTPTDADELCRTEEMSTADVEKLYAKVEAEQQAAQKKQRKNEQRPVPISWGALKKSSHPADTALVKSIESMKWWGACVAWGREARAKTMSRRGTALEQFLSADKTINAVDLSNVRSNIPTVGQTSCGTFAILGLPTKSNTTNSGSTVRIQHVYRERNIYVYVTGVGGDHNGLVTSTQY